MVADPTGVVLPLPELRAETKVPETASERYETNCPYQQESTGPRSNLRLGASPSSFSMNEHASRPRAPSLSSSASPPCHSSLAISTSGGGFRNKDERELTKTSGNCRTDVMTEPTLMGRWMARHEIAGNSGSQQSSDWVHDRYDEDRSGRRGGGREDDYAFDRRAYGRRAPDE